MNLAGASVRRPIFTTMVTLIVVVIGVVSMDRLRIDLLPAIELPTITVRTDYEGASPEVMERLVTQVIEEIVATVPGVEELTSTSSEGESQVRARFAWGIDVDTAAIDVTSRIESEMNELPDEIERPRVSKFDVQSFPIVLLGVSGDLDPVELTRLVEDQIRYRFARIPGVAQVDPWGGYPREVRIELDPDRLKALGLPLDLILDAVRDANLDLPTGKIDEGRHEITLRAPAEFRGLGEIRDTVLVEREGGAITLGQVAHVRDTYEKITRIVRVNGQRGLRIAIRKEADANTVEVSQRILDEVEAVRTAFPQLTIVPVSNQGNFIERSISNVARSVLYGGGLAVLVLLLFLRSVRSTVVISLAIPISVVATFALMLVGGLTLNLMTLGGLALGVGMMVDSSVVVLENVFRRREERRESPATAAVSGTVEVATAIVASTITTLVIFLPLVFVRGVTGLLFRDLAYVILFALVCSLLVSLSLVPMLASKLLSGGRAGAPADGEPRRRGPAAAFFHALDEVYRDLLRLVLRQRLLTTFVSAAALFGSLLLLPRIGTEFLPPSDEGEVRVTGEMEVGTRLELVDRQTRKLERAVEEAVPERVASIVTVQSDEETEGEIQLSLPPASARDRSNTEVAADLRRRLEGTIAGMEIRTRAPQGQFLMQRVLGTEEGIAVDVRGFELATLDVLAAKVAEGIADVPGVTDVEITRKAGTPQHEIRIDRDKIADLGLSVRDVTRALATAVAGSRAGEFRSQGNSYRILVQLEDAERRSLDEILDLTLQTGDGEQVALRNLVDVVRSSGPLEIARKDQQRVATVTANVAGRDLGSVAADVRVRLDRIPRPASYDLSVAGAFEEQERSFDDLFRSLLLALVLVYMVLACQYESLVDPLVVMLSVPVASVGVLVTLFLTGTTLNVQSTIGCIMLGGIVVNNAILLVDQAGRLRREGRTTDDAVAEAGRRRLRPILMTTLTTILALLPLAFGVGEGADAQAPMARAVVGGLTGSSLITLVLIPAVYSMVHRERRSRTRSAPAESA
ncbi:MAG: efflux RND transporter permease subunit [Planctomycetota bacterium JB042]